MANEKATEKDLAKYWTDYTQKVVKRLVLYSKVTCSPVLTVDTDYGGVTGYQAKVQKILTF